MPNSEAVPAGKNDFGSKVSMRASATVPASGPRSRDSVETPRLGVAKPPAWSLEKVTPMVAGVTASNGAFVGVSFTISAKTPAPRRGRS